MKRFRLLPGLLATAMVAFAHGGLTHVMGTVTTLSATQVDVKTVDGKTATVAVTADTKWMKGKTAIAERAVKAGDRVVIHAKAVDGKLLAVEVAVGTKTAEKP